DYIDMLSFFGYNLIETEPQHLVVSKNQSAAVQEKTVRLRDLLISRIRRNGMRQMMHFPGTLTGDDKRFEHLSNEKSVPYGSDTEKRYEEYYRIFAEAAAPYLDFVMTHWVDS